MAYDKNTKGYVYILTNPVFSENLLKIGMTTRTPEQRARELYEGATGLPSPFEVAYKRTVEHCEIAETIVHQRLDNFRSNQYREFFSLELEKAIEVIDEVIDEVRELYSVEKKKDESSFVEAPTEASVPDSSFEEETMNDDLLVEEPPPETPEGYMALEEFSKLKGIPEDKIIKMIRDGFYTGKKVREYWYVSNQENSSSANSVRSEAGYQFRWWHILVAWVVIKGLLVLARTSQYQGY